MATRHRTRPGTCTAVIDSPSARPMATPTKSRFPSQKKPDESGRARATIAPEEAMQTEPKPPPMEERAARTVHNAAFDAAKARGADFHCASEAGFRSEERRGGEE